jgi:hypothetical protein
MMDKILTVYEVTYKLLRTLGLTTIFGNTGSIERAPGRLAGISVFALISKAYVTRRADGAQQIDGPLAAGCRG